MFRRGNFNIPQEGFFPFMTCNSHYGENGSSGRISISCEESSRRMGCHQLPFFIGNCHPISCFGIGLTKTGVAGKEYFPQFRPAT